MIWQQYDNNKKHCGLYVAIHEHYHPSIGLGTLQLKTQCSCVARGAQTDLFVRVTEIKCN